MTHVRKHDEESTNELKDRHDHLLSMQEVSNTQKTTKNLHTNSSLLADSQAHLGSQPTIERTTTAMHGKRVVTNMNTSVHPSVDQSDHDMALRSFLESRYMRIKTNDFNEIIETTRRNSVKRGSSCDSSQYEAIVDQHVPINEKTTG